ncbi:MAG TPA: 3-hydroxyacyl-CoA dehydrogenase NAD-binding domain-containing protein [Crenalkalicoccus sp.]|jgi:3-hydroxyacyl-CoA dehydrogenase|nr:3-hydroxyacyl-CoA dehydrogenase NAD-binding domain-containing protein [Crenalkalicoccus sp.]
MTEITRVAVIGTGVIGASWATWFLARGLDVSAADPAPGAEAALRRAVAAHWPAMEAMGLAPGASPDRLSFAAEPEAALEGAGFVQENGPERLEHKRALFARLDAAAPAGVVLASSSSTLLMSEVQSACTRHPERVVLGHPFNPPHLIPLVEVVGGRGTSEAAIASAMAFYAAIGKKPVRLKREILGHIANRLQAALWQEAVHLVQAGVADVADIDTAIAHGPGLRWALLGPFLNLHLSGGTGGIEHLLAHLGPPTEAMWRDLGTATLTGGMDATIAAGVRAELATLDEAAMVRRRDAVLLELLRLKAASRELP